MSDMNDLGRLIRERLDQRRIGDASGQLEDNAIRAVLELHQPYWDVEHAAATCPVCPMTTLTRLSLPWPCPTVRRIASALGITQEVPPSTGPS